MSVNHDWALPASLLFLLFASIGIASLFVPGARRRTVTIVSYVFTAQDYRIDGREAALIVKEVQAVPSLSMRLEEEDAFLQRLGSAARHLRRLEPYEMDEDDYEAFR